MSTNYHASRRRMLDSYALDFAFETSKVFIREGYSGPWGIQPVRDCTGIKVDPGGGEKFLASFGEPTMLVTPIIARYFFQ